MSKKALMGVSLLSHETTETTVAGIMIALAITVFPSKSTL